MLFRFVIVPLRASIRDSLLSKHLSENFHVFVAAGILESKRRDIINNRMLFDELLRLCNSLAGTLRVEDILVGGEKVKGCSRYGVEK